MEYETVFTGVAEPTPPTTQQYSTESASLPEALVDPIRESPETVAALGLAAVGLFAVLKFAMNRPKPWAEYLRDK